jgi:hypothetical protein
MKINPVKLEDEDIGGINKFSRRCKMSRTRATKSNSNSCPVWKEGAQKSFQNQKKVSYLRPCFETSKKHANILNPKLDIIKSNSFGTECFETIEQIETNFRKTLLNLDELSKRFIQSTTKLLDTASVTSVVRNYILCSGDDFLTVKLSFCTQNIIIQN